jgi:hypothetical protein
MSIGPMAGLAAGVAATPMAQATGSDVDRAEQASSNQDRRVRNEERAEEAAGIGQADGEDHETADRDADGRQPWEFSQGAGPSGPDADGTSRLSKDASHQSGNLLDLTG